MTGILIIIALLSVISRKKGAAFSFVLLAAVALLVIGILSVTAAHSKTVTMTPIFTSASFNQSYNFTVTNTAGGAAISEVRVTIPTGFSTVVCNYAVPAGGWTCTRDVDLTYAEFTGSTIAAGGSQTFNITAISAASPENYTFQIRTLDSDSATNTSRTNVTVDAHPPIVTLVNVSDGTNVLSGNEMSGLFFLKNTSTGMVFVINVTDNSSGMGNGRVTMFYNVSSIGSTLSPLLITLGNASAINVTNSTASNGSYGQVGLYNVTLNISAMKSLNGSRIGFVILANDSVQNGNLSNSSNSTAVSTYVYNFTIDAVAPQFNDVEISNGSQVNTNALNTTKTFGGFVEHIINSSLFLNLTVNVSDSGGSGTVLVEVLNRTGGFMKLDLLTGANGSAGQTVWKINATTNVSGGNGNFNITDLIQGFSGDGRYNITFRATDNVSNQNATYNFTVEVDDSPPTAAVTSNISISGPLLSAGNATLSNDTLNSTAFVLRIETVSNINNVTANISVWGQAGLVFNMTYEGGTPSGTSRWNLTIKNDTLSSANLSQFCVGNLGGDGTSCSFRFNFTDVMGRHNDTLNLTVFVDSNAPAVFAVSPVSLTTNYSTSLFVNFTVNDTVGLQNVSFRFRNITNLIPGEGAYGDTATSFTTGNVTNWIPMSLGTGFNYRQPSNGSWNFTINLTALNLRDGTYTVEVNATDTAGRSNFSANVTSVIFDSSIPTNISIVAPGTNTFWNANFTVNLNATEVVSGLKNVSVRLENGTHNTPWVGVAQALSALTTSGGAGETTRFNLSNFNLTHVGAGTSNITLNASNGNFTLRLNVTDSAGNQNTSITINLTIDTIAPGVTLVEPVNLINRTANFTINLSATESNVGTVQYRWENGSDLTNQGQNVSNWITFFSNAGGANNWNSTFNVTEGTPLATNYTVRVNVTDKAGNQNSSIYVQLVIDNKAPLVVASSNDSLANSVQTGDFVVNLTINDTGTWGMMLGKIVSTNVNATAFRLENKSFNSTGFNITFATVDLTDANSNRTNATFTFSSVANGRYDLRFFVNDTSGNQNSTVTILNITLDNVAPSVAISVVNVSPAASGSTGLTGNITFNASVNDNLPLNISITSLSAGQGQTYGVFYRFENSTFNGSWLPMSVSASVANLSSTFNASNFSNTLADGDYNVRINATDTANNQNTSVFTTITIQNGGSKVRAVNLTFQGGIFNGFANSSSDAYTFLVNTTANATCRYSLDVAVTYYDDMTSTMSNNVSRQHNIAFGPFRDVAASGGGYNVTNVLSSLMQGTAAGNFTKIYAYNASTDTWQSFRVGQTGNSFINFSDESEYWINVTQLERIEVR
ncbi:hypothetical protein HYU18_05135 [Candidatus Woesearchaeota archaeon]|nr:hypothetical protein [Candidatus Woesearchaeota archaeon]